jgi:hypothetical protein
MTVNAITLPTPISISLGVFDFAALAFFFCTLLIARSFPDVL